MKPYNKFLKRLKELLNPKIFRRLPESFKRRGKVKIYTEEEIYLYKVRKYGEYVSTQ